MSHFRVSGVSPQKYFCKAAPDSEGRIVHACRPASLKLRVDTLAAVLAIRIHGWEWVRSYAEQLASHFRALTAAKQYALARVH